MPQMRRLSGICGNFIIRGIKNDITARLKFAGSIFLIPTQYQLAKHLVFGTKAKSNENLPVSKYVLVELFRREKMRNFVFKNSGVLLPNLQCKC